MIENLTKVTNERLNLRSRSSKQKLTLNRSSSQKLSKFKLYEVKCSPLRASVGSELQYKARLQIKRQSKPLSQEKVQRTNVVYETVNASSLIIEESFDRRFDLVATKKHLKDKENHPSTKNLSSGRKLSFVSECDPAIDDSSRISINCLPQKHDFSNFGFQKIYSSGIQVAIQTQYSEFNRESYKEYMQLKITKKDKIQKLKSLFDYIQNLTCFQIQNIKNNKNQITEIFNCPIDENSKDLRQRRVDDLIKDIPSKYHDFQSTFKKTLAKQKKFGIELCENQKNFQHVTKKLLRELQEKILQFMTEKQIYSQTITPKEISCLFEWGLRKHDTLLAQNNLNFKNRMTEFHQNYQFLQKTFNEWKANADQKQMLVRNCVMNIMQLPQLTIGLFGSEKSTTHDKTNEQIKSHCLNKKVIPHMSDFFLKRGHPDQKQIDQLFMKCCQVKCMNCIYMRNKLKFVYDKNNELKPILKVLMHLINPQTPKTEFEQGKFFRG